MLALKTETESEREHEERARTEQNADERERRARAEEERYGSHKPDRSLPRPVGGSDVLIGFHCCGFLTDAFADLLGRTWPGFMSRPG